MRKVIEKLLFQTEGSTKYMILNFPGVILKIVRNKRCYNRLPFITLLETWGGKNQNSNFPNLSSTYNSTKSNNLVVQC